MAIILCKSIGIDLELTHICFGYSACSEVSVLPIRLRDERFFKKRSVIWGKMTIFVAAD